MYIRHSFDLPNLEDYQVLNCRIQFVGGVAAYLNGQLVARFNLQKEFDADTESISIHDRSRDGRFHVILSTSGAVVGTNVMAFEVHRPVGTSSSEPVVFDATGVLGVEECSTVIDSYLWTNSSALIDGSVEGILDLDPFTVGVLEKERGAFVEWEVENLEGSRWNVLNMFISENVTSWGFDLMVMERDEYDGRTLVLKERRNKNRLVDMSSSSFSTPSSSSFSTPSSSLTSSLSTSSNSIRNITENDFTTTLLHLSSTTVQTRLKPSLSIQAALRGFRQFRWQIHRPGSANPAIGALFTQYCKAAIPTAICPAIPPYPSVGEGQLSPGPCEDGYVGYSYRLCEGGVLGEVQYGNCTQRLPKELHYQHSEYQWVRDTAVTTGRPFFVNVIERFYLEEGNVLPEGLTFNETTGEVTGIPRKLAENTVITVCGENQRGVAKAMLSIVIRVGRCQSEGLFPSMEVGQTAVMDCGDQGDYVGTLKRECILGEVDGVWRKPSGYCIPYGLVVVSVVVVVLLVVVIVLLGVLLIRRERVHGVERGKGRNAVAGVTAVVTGNETV